MSDEPPAPPFWSATSNVRRAGELTLAAIGEEAGVMAGAIVQRFGSKRELLLALSAGAAGAAPDLIAGFEAKHTSPLAALREYAACMAALASSPEALARNLAYLQIDLTDADFRRPLLVQAKATRTGLAALLARAVKKREVVKRTNTDALDAVLISYLAKHRG